MTLSSTPVRRGRVRTARAGHWARKAGTAAIALALLALPACDGDSGATQTPGPSGSPDPSASSTVTPSVTPSPTSSRTPAPTLPPEAKGLTVESADAFMKFYLQLLDHGAATGETAPLKAWSDKGCISCRQLINRRDQVRAGGGSYTGDFRYSEVKSVSVQLNKKEAARVIFTARVGQHRVLPKSGGTATKYPVSALKWRLTLAARSGRWIAYEIRAEK